MITKFLIIFFLLLNFSNAYAQVNSNNVINAALVLEGGAMRTLFTAGVLDVFMENDIKFSTVIGVSAGALTGANYIARHIGRSAKINILHSNDRNYFGIRQLLFRRNIFNFNYLFHSPIRDLYPFNEQALVNSEQRFLIGATNMITGQIEYFERHNYDDLVHVLQASSSIPLLSRPVIIDGIAYLDGAISDPIGIHKAIYMGYDKIVVISTRPYGHRRSEISRFIRFLFRISFRNFPELMAVLKNGTQAYNLLFDEINEMERENKVFVIRPSRDVNIRNLERNARRLAAFYFQGRYDARVLLPKMIEYINQ